MAVVRQAGFKKHHKIGREELSVREHMGIILRTLQEQGGFVRFEALFDPTWGRRGWWCISWPCSSWGGKIDPYYADRSLCADLRQSRIE